MKIVLLAGANSIHTVRWANGLDSFGHEVHVISQQPIVDNQFSDTVKLHLFPYRGPLGYFLIVPQVRNLLYKLKPDIVNAHYASGYGTTARLVNYHPWVLSVWGSDVYDFPHKSFLHKWLVRNNLYSADRVASTSHCMAKETYNLAPNLSMINITPFGVDLDDYKAIKKESSFQKETVVIGTVKTMSYKYGIDTLIHAYALLLDNVKYKQKPKLELRLVGGGEQTSELMLLTEHLGISESVKFIGQVPHSQVPQELNKLDIYVALSRLESFGVAIVEASASACPVIVSDVGGLPEVTVEGETGFVVPSDNPKLTAEAMEKLLMNPALREQMGNAGRKHVEQKYSWHTCLETMLNVYQNTINTVKNNILRTK